MSHGGGGFIGFPACRLERPQGVAGADDAAGLAVAFAVIIDRAAQVSLGVLGNRAQRLSINHKSALAGEGKRQSRHGLVVTGKTLAV